MGLSSRCEGDASSTKAALCGFRVSGPASGDSEDGRGTMINVKLSDGAGMDVGALEHGLRGEEPARPETMSFHNGPVQRVAGGLYRLTTLTSGTDVPFLDTFHPAWHPDGSMIALSLSKEQNRRTTQEPAQANLFLMRLSDPMQILPLTFDATEKQEPAWSPDGSRLVYAGATLLDEPGGNWDLFMLEGLEPTGGRIQPKAISGVGNPGYWFRPDGRASASSGRPGPPMAIGSPSCATRGATGISGSRRWRGTTASHPCRRCWLSACRVRPQRSIEPGVPMDTALPSYRTRAVAGIFGSQGSLAPLVRPRRDAPAMGADGSSWESRSFRRKAVFVGHRHSDQLDESETTRYVTTRTAQAAAPELCGYRAAKVEDGWLQLRPGK